MMCLKSLTPRARKDHRCDLCYEAIKAGELYARTSFASDGRVWDQVTHKSCQDVLNWWCQENPWEDQVDLNDYPDILEQYNEARS